MKTFLKNWLVYFSFIALLISVFIGIVCLLVWVHDTFGPAPVVLGLLFFFAVALSSFLACTTEEK